MSSSHINLVLILYNTTEESTACSFNIQDLKENSTGGKVFTEAIQGQAIFHADNGKIGKMRAIRRPLEIFLAISTGIFLSIFNAIFTGIFLAIFHAIFIGIFLAIFHADHGKKVAKQDLQCDRPTSCQRLFPITHRIHTVYSSSYSSTRFFVNIFK